MSTTGGHLFGQHVLEGHRHITDVNNYCLLMFPCHFYFISAKSLLIIRVFQTFHFSIRSSSTSRTSPVGRVFEI